MERFILYLALLIAGYFIVYVILKKKITASMDPQAVLQKIREEVDRIIVGLNSTTDRNITLLEDRVKSLADMLQQADKKIGVLRRETEKHELAAKLYSELAGKRVTEPEEQPEDVHSRVVKLHREGVTPSVIGKRLGITQAEIELILSLAEKNR